MAEFTLDVVEQYPLNDPRLPDTQPFGLIKRLENGDSIQAETHSGGLPAEGSYSLIVPTELGAMAAVNYFKSLEEFKALPVGYRSEGNFFTHDGYSHVGEDEDAGELTTEAIRKITKFADEKLSFFRLDTPKMDVSWQSPRKKFVYSTRKTAEIGLMFDDLGRERIQKILGGLATPSVGEILGTTLDEFAEYFPQLRRA